MKKILITGAGSGLGFELAKAYGAQGHYIVLVGRTEGKLVEAQNSLAEHGIQSECHVCDISDFDSVSLLRETIEKRHGAIDYLVNNAGVGFFGPLHTLELDEINMMLDINVKGTILMTQSFMNCTLERILNIISTAGLKGKPNESAYVATKFAVRGFSESLQKEFEGQALKVTAVYMGGMNTPFWDESTHIKDKSRLKSAKDVAEEIVQKDDGRPEIIIGGK